MRSPTFLSYCRLLFEPFFKWWWAAITGVASILSYLALPESGVAVSKLGVATGVLVGLFLLFLVLSVVWQGWLLYAARFAELRVAAINKCKDYGGEYVVVLRGLRVESGVLLELHRFVGEVEVPVAVVEVMQTNSLGEHQARPLWFAPGHLRDFGTRKYDATDLRVRMAVSRPTIERCFDVPGTEPGADESGD